MADVRYASGGTADISSPFCFAPAARASDELSVASWGGPSSFDTTLSGILSRNTSSLSRSLSSGLAVNTSRHPNKRARARHNSSFQPGRNNSNSAGLLLGNNIESFPEEASGVDLSTSFQNNPIARFYFDPEQPWVPPGLAEPVPNAPSRRNAVSHQQSTNFEFRAGPHSDLGAATSNPDSGYASGIIDSQSCRSGEGADSAGQFELLGSFDSLQSFPNMSTAFPPTPRSDGADSQQMNNVPRANGSTLEPCQICGAQSKCPSDFKKHMLKHNKPFKCTQPGCARTQGFITVNDLNRHLKSVHKLKGDCKTKSYKCASSKCRNPDKEWPRLDNFKQHIIRMHPNEDLNDLISRSELKEPSLLLENTLSGMDASKYRSDQPSTDPANLMLSPSSQQTFTSSGWNAIQPRHDNENRLPPISTSSPAFLMNDSRKPPSPNHLHHPPQIHDPRHLSPPNYAGNRKPPVSAGISILAEAAVADASAPRRTSQSWADVMGLTNSQRGPHPGPGYDRGQQDTLHSLTALITNSIKNANGASLEDTVYRAVTQALGTNRMEPPNHQNGPQPQYRNQLLPPQHRMEISAINDAQSDGSEDLMDEEEVAKGIERLASLLKKQTRQKKHTSGSRVCQHCKKVLPRACDMNKHIKRHTRPFGCTFHKCNKVFGSKNDWKRHENSQHYQSLMFRCPVPEASKKYGVCAKIFYAQPAFEEHLKDGHKVADNELVQGHVREGRIGKGYQGRFWCGFCKKIIDLKEQGVGGWDERFNHIDNHYKEGIRVDQWVVPETNQTKEEMLAEAERRKADRLFPEDDEDMPASSSSSSSADEIPSISVTSPSQDSNPLKRKTPHDEEVSASASGSGSASAKEWLYFCCQCGLGPWAASLYSSCGLISQECNHVFCGNCTRKTLRKKGAVGQLMDFDITRHV